MVLLIGQESCQQESCQSKESSVNRGKIVKDAVLLTGVGEKA